MSVSFGFRARTVAAALAIATARMEAVVAQQPVHAVDRDSMVKAIEANLGHVAAAATDNKHVYLNASSSVTTAGDVVLGVNTSVNIYLIDATADSSQFGEVTEAPDAPDA